jgi:pimeloyl-ACP methyl ester carboxylesterase
MQMRKWFLFLILQIMIVAGCAPAGATSSANAPTSNIPLSDCVLTSPGVDNQVDAKCGLLAVLEDPTNPKSRQINLSIAVVPAIQRSPEPDPLFILVGGPGQSAIEVFPALYSVLYKIHEKRDIILVDQRGTGKSNPLRCLDPNDETLNDEQTIAILKACPKKLDADLRYYTTDIAMQDLDQVRSSLGYETINLYGVSYGTRAALVYLKMYPAHVRSVILDAVVDPKFILYRDVAQDGQRALELFFTRCEKDEVCNGSFPHLRSEFDTLLKKLQATPAEIEIPHPVTGKPLQLTVTSTMLTNIIFNSLYVSDLVAMLPLSIHQANSEGNFAPLITQSYLSDPGIYDGMFYAVACSEDAPLISPSQVEQESKEGLFGKNAEIFVQVCSAWPHGNPPNVVHEAVTSNVPALMFSGEADPITPPWHAEQLGQTLGNSLNLTFANMGHGNAITQCGSQIVDHFIESASIKDLDITCIKTVEPPPFWVDFSGPQP